MELCKQPIISPITAIITPGPAISCYYLDWIWSPRSPIGHCPWYHNTHGHIITLGTSKANWAEKISVLHFSFYFMLNIIIDFQRIAQGYQKSLQWNVEPVQFMRGAWLDAFKYSCFTFYWSLSSFADIGGWKSIQHSMFNETNNKISNVSKTVVISGAAHPSPDCEILRNDIIIRHQ